ncbi:MAG: hypothetical protein EHM20_14160, partial [Alphaproteobacteria bacterium]
MSKITRALSAVAFFALSTGSVFAQAEAATASTGGFIGTEKAVKYFAYFICLGVAVYGGTAGQSKAA